MGMGKRRPLKPVKEGSPYEELWKLMDGAVRDAFDKHPEYLPNKKRGTEYTIRMSIVKRATGAAMSFVERSTKSRTGEPAG